MPVALIPAALSVVGGAIQHFTSGAKKKENALENYANTYQPNSSIMDYYNKALNNYSANPYTSAAYQNQTNQINRNLQGGIAASSDRRGGLSTLTGLVQGADDAEAKAGINAEATNRANLGLLGRATGMKSAEDFKPFQMKYNLLAAKAGAAAKQKSMGLQNMFGGLSSAATALSGGLLGSKQTAGTNTDSALWQAPNAARYQNINYIPKDERFPG